ncbi:MAG: Hsp20/alpha crystallin family protein [Treponema sp.]|jgi:HSP20 family protein|nr:Hsp20/alpha crystallin family protein [Treponema sp.]
MAYSVGFYNPRFTSNLFDELERKFFDRFNGSEEASFVPPVDVKESADRYEVDIDLPGMKENEVDIDLNNQVLTISARKETEEEKQGDTKWLVHERNVRSYTRRFTLPPDTDPAKIAAHFENGVLSVFIPRKNETKSCKIPITLWTDEKQITE